MRVYGALVNEIVHFVLFGDEDDSGRFTVWRESDRLNILHQLVGTDPQDEAMNAVQTVGLRGLICM